MANLTDDEARELQNHVFGPCSALYECCDFEDLRKSLAEQATVQDWFRIQMSVEDITMDRMSIPMAEFEATLTGYRERFAKFLEQHPHLR